MEIAHALCRSTSSRDRLGLRQRGRRDGGKRTRREREDVRASDADGGAKFDPSATPPGDVPSTSMIRLTEDDPRKYERAATCRSAKERDRLKPNVPANLRLFSSTSTKRLKDLSFYGGSRGYQSYLYNNINFTIVE